MKTIIFSLGFTLILLCFNTTQTSYAIPINTQYSCAPPFIANVAKPNIHFVLDITGSMAYYPYVRADSSYDRLSGYYGYFKEDKYYNYDSTNSYWVENTSCTNSDYIGSTNAATGTCVSGNFLNYVTSNKYDIMRKILTGGRPKTNTSSPYAVTDATVLEHNLAGSSDDGLSNEATTNCSISNSTAGQVNIYSPNPTTATSNVTTISSASNLKKIAVTSVGGRTTFTITGGTYSTAGIVAGTTQIVTSGFAASANNSTWTVYSITSTVLTVTTNTGVAVAATKNIKITTVPLTSLTGVYCKMLAKTDNVPVKITTNTTITRQDTATGGSFVADGWVAGMKFDADGFTSTNSNISNNNLWTIASGGVTPSTLTLTTNMVNTITGTTATIRFTQNLTAYVRVKYATSETPFTGVIQSMYNDDKTKAKADIELSFFNDNGSDSVDYSGGTGTLNTVKNQLLANYVNAVNITNGTNYTNTGPAMMEAEKFFKQVAVSTTITHVPSSGTALIAPKNGASDPFYEPPLDGTAATNSNSTAAPCRKAFIILVSDGEWNVGSDPVGPAYNMHRRDLTGGTQYDLRPDTAQPDLPGAQAVTTYTVYAFGDSAKGRNALITTAIFGGFEDNDKNNLPYPFTSAPGAPTAYTSVALNTAAHSYTNSNYVAGTKETFPADDVATFPLDECDPGAPADTTVTPNIAARAANWNAKCSEWDKSIGPTTELPDQRHTGLPYNYFEPTDGSGSALAQSINDAITSIFAKVSSGTAASILSNSEGTGANLLQAVYYPSKVFADGAEIAWIGEMQNLWYYVDPFISNSSVREDTDGDRVLNLLNDYTTAFFFNGTETKVQLNQDTNGDGVGETLIKASIDPDDVKSIWRAGRQLHTRTASTRKIYTSKNGVSLDLFEQTVDNPNAEGLKLYLQAADSTESTKIINYVRGTDQTGYRARKGAFTVTDPSSATEWKLGDIISSTPRLQSSNRISLFDIPSPSGYGDTSYAKFIESDNYKNRGMVYVGANDGMFHAFKLGKLTVSGPSISGNVKARLTGEGTEAGTKLGDEQWAYIPRNALPYLKYLTGDSTYSPNSSKHLYYVDGATVLADVSVGKPTGCITANISDCTKDTTYGSNWRTVLIGSMGIGGATAIKTSTCLDIVPGVSSTTTNDPFATCVKTPILDPAAATKGLGYSSYFAFDITNQYFNSSGALLNPPTLKWEFTPPGLGYSTSGAAIVRINPDKAKNGKSFAVFASGPTGPVSGYTGDFLAKSDQNLQLFVVDLEATGALEVGTNYWVIDTGIKRAFGGSMINASVDTDRWNAGAPGNYQDEVVYVGYSKANIDDGAAITAATEWTNGGVIRLMTKESANPADWTTSTVISGVGAVTSGIARLQDRKNKKLWLYFGTGRFYYGGDDKTTQRYIMGVADPCYKADNTILKTCTDTLAFSTSSSDFNSQSDITSCDMTNIDGTSKKGWYIPLELSTTTMNAERSITDPVSLTNGMVQFTTFMPAADVCKFGGDSYIWAVKFDDGCTIPAAKLTGKVLVQVSTGAFEEVDLKTALTAKDGRRTGTPLTGRPPSPPPPIVTNAGNKPPKKILHLQEK